jgi:hypothetical protein
MQQSCRHTHTHTPQKKVVVSNQDGRTEEAQQFLPTRGGLSLAPQAPRLQTVQPAGSAPRAEMVKGGLDHPRRTELRVAARNEVVTALRGAMCTPLTPTTGDECKEGAAHAAVDGSCVRGTPRRPPRTQCSMDLVLPTGPRARLDAQGRVGEPAVLRDDVACVEDHFVRSVHGVVCVRDHFFYRGGAVR